MSQQAHAINHFNGQNDTINKVSIKVILLPKSLDTTRSKNDTNLKNSDPIIRETNRPQPFRSSVKRHKPTKSEDNSGPPRILSNFKSKNPIIEDTLRSAEQNSTNEKKIQKEAEANRQKNIFFLISLLLILIGIIVAIFFRSTLPLAAAVLFVIIGYYILMYVLLFI